MSELWEKDEEGNWNTWCAGCVHYVQPEDDYAECNETDASPFGEWVDGKCQCAASFGEAAGRGGDAGSPTSAGSDKG